MIIVAHIDCGLYALVEQIEIIAKEHEDIILVDATDERKLRMEEIVLQPIKIQIQEVDFLEVIPEQSSGFPVPNNCQCKSLLTRKSPIDRGRGPPDPGGI